MIGTQFVHIAARSDISELSTTPSVVTTAAEPEAVAAFFDEPIAPDTLELPCELEISEAEGDIGLDFHARATPLMTVRFGVQRLADYLNDKRRKPDAIETPGVHRDAKSFALRHILDANPVARVEPLPDGARLLLRPADPARLDVLRARVLWHAAELLPGLPLSSNTCPVLPELLSPETG